MPVVFVLSKAVTSKISSSYPVRRGGSSSDKKGQNTPPEGVSRGQVLPAVPKGTLSGLRSLIRKAGLTQRGQPTSTDPAGSFTELRTIEEDLDYHAGLRKELTDVNSEVQGPELAYMPRIGSAH